MRSARTAYPCHTNAAREVMEVLLNDIIPNVWGPFGVLPFILRMTSEHIQFPN